MLFDLTFASHLDPSIWAKRKADTSSLQLRALPEQAPVDFEEMRYW
jgi:hypothetical protein